MPVLRSFFAVILALILSTSVSLADDPAPASTGAPKPAEVPVNDTTVVKSKAVNLSFAYDRFGNIEPCGCSYGPRGGIEREYISLQQLRKKYSGTWKHFSAGSTFLQNSEDEDPSKTTFNLKKAKALTKGLNNLRTTAVSVSPIDLGIGCANLKTLKGIAKFPFIASNTEVSDKNCNGLTKPYLHLKDTKPNLVILSFWKAIGNLENLVPTEVKVLDPEAVLEKLAAKSEFKNSTWVILSNLETDEIRKISEKFPHTQIWLGSQGLNIDRLEQQNRHTLVSAIDSEGKNIGLVRFENKSPNGAFFNVITGAAFQRNIKGYQETVGSLETQLKDSDGKEKENLEGRIADLKKLIAVYSAAPATDAPELLHYKVDGAVLDKNLESKTPNPNAKVIRDYKGGLRAEALKGDELPFTPKPAKN